MCCTVARFSHDPSTNLPVKIKCWQTKLVWTWAFLYKITCRFSGIIRKHQLRCLYFLTRFLGSLFFFFFIFQTIHLGNAVVSALVLQLLSGQFNTLIPTTMFKRNVSMLLHFNKRSFFANLFPFVSPEIGNAYAVLSNPEKRRQYDLTGGEEPSSPSHSHRGGFDFHRGFEADITPEDLFNMFFGGGFPPCKWAVRLYFFDFYPIWLRRRFTPGSSHLLRTAGSFQIEAVLIHLGRCVPCLFLTWASMCSTASPQTFTNGRTSYSQQTDYRQERTEERGDVSKYTFKIIFSYFSQIIYLEAHCVNKHWFIFLTLCENIVFFFWMGSLESLCDAVFCPKSTILI